MQESIQLVIDSLPYLLKGAVFTLQLSIGGMFFGLVLGFILALMRLSPVLPVRWLALLYLRVSRYAAYRPALYDLLRLTAVRNRAGSDSGGDDWPVAQYRGVHLRNPACGHLLH